MHWTSKNRGQANIGVALEALGWRLWGWSDDKSDSMTDYYCPASWGGIATLGEGDEQVVAVVGCATYTHDSGREITESREVDRGECPVCQGSGVDPSGWTLQKARENPHAYNQQTGPKGSICLMPDVVSPAPFDDHGRLRCEKCHGRGRLIDYEHVVVDHFPEFQANPSRSGWHVERGGHIFAKGVGRFEACSRNEGGCEVAAKVAKRIDSAARTGGTGGGGGGVKEPAELPEGAEALLQAKPKRLKSGGWGALVSGGVPEEGDRIAVHARNGKAWVAAVSAVLWAGEDRAIVRTSRIDAEGGAA